MIGQTNLWPATYKVNLHFLGLRLGLLLVQQQVLLQAAHRSQGLCSGTEVEQT